MENFVVGLIGMGDMGKMYAERLSAAGWRIDPYLILLVTANPVPHAEWLTADYYRILACDREENQESLQKEYAANVWLIDSCLSLPRASR
jgi:prephenate dehydrogenase (NADP+)